MAQPKSKSDRRNKTLPEFLKVYWKEEADESKIKPFMTLLRQLNIEKTIMTDNCKE